MQLQRLERIYYQYFDGLSGENCALILTFCLFVEKYRRSSSSRSTVVVVACLGHRTVEEELVVAAPRSGATIFVLHTFIFITYILLLTTGIVCFVFRWLPHFGTSTSRWCVAPACSSFLINTTGYCAAKRRQHC